MDATHKHVQATLGQTQLPEPHAPASDDFVGMLLCADSCWAHGKVDEANSVLQAIEQQVKEKNKGWDQGKHGPFADGLKALLQGDLPTAYECYVRAGKANDQDVFAIERAVNIAFWMACSDKMLSAGMVLADVVETRPFAGGVLAFAQHMKHDSRTAENTAMRAIEKGFNDPWTVHAVAHCMYSLGRSQECVEWLRKYEPECSTCSVFMKTHMFFHESLCLLDLERWPEIVHLIQGSLYGGLVDADKTDYWAATQPLNTLWKAELRGVCKEETRLLALAADSLAHLGDAAVERSKVFALCILRFSSDWLDKILETTEKRAKEAQQAADKQEDPSTRSKRQKRCQQEKEGEVDAASVNAPLFVWSNVARAVHAHYHQTNPKRAAELLLPVVSRLAELGASPEQREVIDEFAVVCLAAGGKLTKREKATWLAKHSRPNVRFYEHVRQLQ